MRRILLFLITLFFVDTVSAGTITTSAEIITIPVVVHVMYHNANENISDAQILSQLVVLNKDFRGNNADRAKVPAYFAPLAADAGFEFKLASMDAHGYATTGILRKYTKIEFFGTDDRIKSSVRGGDDAWDRNQYLNIWIGNLAGGILGYTSTYGGPADKDGVVIQYSAFGTIGSVNAPFDLGRTATHEIGHWLNLLHIWGDGYCGDDQVADTPKQRSSNRGVITGEKFSGCEANAHGDMYMNFMDLTNDAGMFMFTAGQRQRMRSSFEAGGARRQILASNALKISTLTAPIEQPLFAAFVSKIAVYPNPASANIIIELKGMPVSGLHTLIIYNYLGHPVMTQMVKGNECLLNVAELKSGVYIIKADNGLVTKFVKN